MPNANSQTSLVRTSVHFVFSYTSASIQKQLFLKRFFTQKNVPLTIQEWEENDSRGMKTHHLWPACWLTISRLVVFLEKEAKIPGLHQPTQIPAILSQSLCCFFSVPLGSSSPLLSRLYNSFKKIIIVQI